MQDAAIAASPFSCLHIIAEQRWLTGHDGSPSIGSSTDPTSFLVGVRP